MPRTHQLFSYNDMNIEYTIAGEGDPILVFHGGHSNCQEQFGYEELNQKGFSIITPSRAGYGKTTKDIGTSLETACAYYIKLLDHLHIDRVHVLAISAGGPTGIQFASQFPDRIRTLTLQSAVTKEWLTRKDLTYRAASVLFHPLTEKYTWGLVSFLSNLFPRFMYNQMAPSFSTLPKEEINSRTNRKDIIAIRNMNKRQRSGHGFMIDLSQTNAVTVEQLHDVSCPTLIMHSIHDGSVPYAHATHAHEHIPHSHISQVDCWGHVLWLSETADEVAHTVRAFIHTNEKKHAT